MRASRSLLLLGSAVTLVGLSLQLPGLEPRWGGLTAVLLTLGWVTLMGSAATAAYERRAAPPGTPPSPARIKQGRGAALTILALAVVMAAALIALAVGMRLA